MPSAPPQPQRSHSITHLTSHLPLTASLISHANPSTGTQQQGADRLGAVKPRAVSFFGESFHYSALPKPLEDDSSDEDDDEPQVPASTRKSSLSLRKKDGLKDVLTTPVAALGPDDVTPSVSPATATATATTTMATANESKQVFQQTSFNYSSFKPLFDTDDDESDSEAEEDAVGGATGRTSKAGLLATPPQVATVVGEPVEDLNLTSAAKGRPEAEVELGPVTA